MRRINTNIKFFLAFALITTISLGLGACSNPNKSSADVQELVIAVPRVGEFNPLKGYNLLAAFGVTETLVEVDSVLSLRPNLAERWETVDEKRWRFYLRKGVQFHDGTRFDAQAAKFSLERYLKAGPAWLDIPPTEIKIEDEYTLLLTAKEPGLLLPAYFTNRASSIISPNSFSEDGRFIKPIGTGPFKFGSGRARWEMVLVRNERYWGGNARLKKVVVKKNIDPQTRIFMLEAGEAGVIQTVPTQEVTRLQASPKYNILKSRFPGNVQLYFNVIKEPFNDLKVRKAVNYAIDRDALVHFFEGHVIPAKAPFPPGLPWSVENLTGYAYDKEKASRLLAKAGWQMGADRTLSKAGKQFEVELLVRGDMLEQVQTAEIVQGQLSEIGIRVNIKSLETGNWMNAMQEKNWHLAVSGRGTLFIADPYAYLTTDFHSKGSYNRTGYQNSEVDRLLELGRRQTDSAKRIAICQQVQRILVEETPIAFLYHPPQIYAVSSKVKALELKSPFSQSLTLGKAYIEGGKR